MQKIYLYSERIRTEKIHSKLYKSDFRKIYKKFIPGESMGLKLIPSESWLFRADPTSVSKPIRKQFVSRLMKMGRTSFRTNPNQIVKPNQSELGLI